MTQRHGLTFVLILSIHVSAYKKLKTTKGYNPRIGQLDTEIKDLKQKIENLKNSNITSIAQQQVKFARLHEKVENHFLIMQKAIQQLKDAAQKSIFPVFNTEDFDEVYRDEILKIFSPLQDGSTELLNTINDSLNSQESTSYT